jgi:hypothetical protein
MTDLRLALHAAAPTPARPLDLGAIRRRAAQRGLRRAVAWIAGGMVVLAAGIGVGDTVFVTSGGGGRHPTGGAFVPRPPDDDNGNAESPTPLASPRTGGHVRAGATGTHTAAATHLVENAAVSGDDFPVRDACSLDTSGMAVGASRRCQFTATATGGAAITSEAPAESHQGTQEFAVGEVYVTRGGKRELMWRSDQCNTADAYVAGVGAFYGQCDRPFIQKGDRVEVVLTKKAEAPFLLTLGAGKDW